MAVNNEEYINQIYDASQKKQEAALKQNYDANLSALEESKQANQKATDANLTRTYVESAQQQKNFDEMQNAYGLSSGAMAQSRLARNIQLQDDLTALRIAQQGADANIERQRNLLGQQYASAIQQAAAANDLEKVKALYQAAKDEDDRLRAERQEAGKFIYQYNNNAIPYLKALGYTDEEIAELGIEAPSSGGGSADTMGWLNALKEGKAKAASRAGSTGAGSTANTVTPAQIVEAVKTSSSSASNIFDRNPLIYTKK